MSQIKVELQAWLGDDRQIANSAWTSSLEKEKKDSRTDSDVKRIVNMLADSKHSVPFESVVFRFWIRMPIAIDRQFMSHRIQSASGMSGRYRTMPSEFLKIPNDIHTIFHKVPFNSSYYITMEYNRLCQETNEFYNRVLTDYKALEKEGVISNNEYKRIREFFRGALPQHNMTERTTIMNLRSFANFIKLRLKPDAQPEIQEVARQMLEAVRNSNVCPIALEALERNLWMI